MPFWETITVYSDNHMKPINTLRVKYQSYWLLKQVLHKIMTVWRVNNKNNGIKYPNNKTSATSIILHSLNCSLTHPTFLLKTIYNLRSSLVIYALHSPYTPAYSISNITDGSFVKALQGLF
jgi:hypothetical protein